jgi:hypothetical protein
MSSTSFASISSVDLSLVAGGQNGQNPNRVTLGDAAEVTGRAIYHTVNPRSLIGNGSQAVRQFNDPRIRDAGTGIRFLNGFCGLFGIDPLRGR